MRAAADGALGPGSAYRRVHALQTHAEAQPAPRLSLLRLHAHLGWRVFGPALAARGHTEATLLHHLMQVQTNVFAVTTLVADAGDGSGVAPLRHVRVGEALYSRACLLNHSCEPNANVAFDGATLELRAAAPLAIGQAVLTCYGPQVGHEPLRARRAKLLNGYFFRCGCVGCAREERDALARRAGSAGGGGDDAARARAEAETLDARARAARERGDYAEAAERCAEALALLRGVFPAGSPQLAHEAAKLGRLYFNARADRRAAAARAPPPTRWRHASAPTLRWRSCAGWRRCA